MKTIGKCISVNQPFASLIAMGYKTIETRVAASSVAKTRHRGPLFIATSQKVHPCWKDIRHTYEPDGYMINNLDPFLKGACDIIWEKCGMDWVKFYDMMMKGQDEPSIIGSCNLKAVGVMTEHHQIDACYSLFPGAKAMLLDNAGWFPVTPLVGIADKFRLGVFNVTI